MNTPITLATSDFELINLWLNGKSRTTVVSYRSHTKQFLDFVGKPLQQMVLDDLFLWCQRLQLTYKPKTVANKMLVIKSLLSFCVKTGYLPNNLGLFIKTPKVKDTLAERIMEVDDVKSMIGAATSERDRLLLSVMYACGLRVSEVCGITWSDMHNGKCTIFGKGNKTRTVNIPTSLWDQLVAMPKVGEYLFTSKSGKQLDRTRVHHIIKACCLSAGLSPKVSSHFLRHSHASHALNNGCNVRLLQQSLGHSKLETTERYLHINPEHSSSDYIQF